MIVSSGHDNEIHSLPFHTLASDPNHVLVFNKQKVTLYLSCLFHLLLFFNLFDRFDEISFKNEFFRKENFGK